MTLLKKLQELKESNVQDVSRLVDYLIEDLEQKWNQKIKFLKIRDVKSPVRWNKKDSWYDLFIPNDLQDLYDAPNCCYTPKAKLTDEEQANMKKTFFNFDKNTIIIPVWYGILIPTWIKMVFPSNNEDNETYDFVLNNKSWVSTKLNLLVWAWVVDNEYRWEMHIHLINTSNKEIEVEAWQKITQGILRKLSTFDVEEISQEEFDKYSQTDRWEGWFGSTWSK